MPLARAREKRDEARKLIADGIDPGELRKADKAQDTESAANSFEAVCREWYAKAYAGKAESTREKTMTRLTKDVFPQIGKKSIAEITAADVRNVIERIGRRGALDIARRCFNYIGRTLRYADSKGLVLRDVSASIALNLILPDKDTRHYAALTDPVVVGGLMRAIDGFTGSFVTTCALKLSALTFVRPGELRHAEWAEIDLDGATWNIPGSKMKMKLDHLVPLSTQTTILNFRHLLQTHRLSARLFDEVNGLLAEKGLLLREDTTVDATLIAAPPSTKNRDGQRDPEMTQTKKGNQWYFGMKAHIGVDDLSGLVHTVVGTTAKTSDMSQFGELLHGGEARISAARGYDYPQIHAQFEENLIEDWVARKAKPGKPLDAWTRNLNRAIAGLRAIGEHPFRILKRQFGYSKVRYRGLEKNTAQLVTLFALGNLYQARRALLTTG